MVNIRFGLFMGPSPQPVSLWVFHKAGVIPVDLQVVENLTRRCHTLPEFGRGK